MKNILKIVIIGVILVVVVISIASLIIFTKKNMSNEEKFTGKIDQIVFGIEWDGNNYMIIDGKHVIFDSPMQTDENGRFDRSNWGSISGFDFLAGPERKEDAKKYYGKNAEVYAEVSDGFDSEGKVQKVYSIFGKKDYYIKLVQ